jgi:DHA2 family multidrug resistance protein-like MFS transporter
LPFHFQEILQFSPVKTGLLMTPWPVGVAAAAPLAGWFADRMPVSTLAGSGLFVMTAGLIAMHYLPGDSSAVMIGLRLGICGFGFASFRHPTIAR